MLIEINRYPQVQQTVLLLRIIITLLYECTKHFCKNVIYLECDPQAKIALRAPNNI